VEYGDWVCSCRTSSTCAEHILYTSTLCSFVPWSSSFIYRIYLYPDRGNTVAATAHVFVHLLPLAICLPVEARRCPSQLENFVVARRHKDLPGEEALPSTKQSLKKAETRAVRTPRQLNLDPFPPSQRLSCSQSSRTCFPMCVALQKKLRSQASSSIVWRMLDRTSVSR
jgi:hypothetical protein